MHLIIIHTCMYIFKENVHVYIVCIFILFININILYINYTYRTRFPKYIHACVCIYKYKIIIRSTFSNTFRPGFTDRV